VGSHRTLTVVLALDLFVCVYRAWGRGAGGRDPSDMTKQPVFHVQLCRVGLTPDLELQLIRFDTAALRARSWEYKYSWESALYLNITENPMRAKPIQSSPTARTMRTHPFGCEAGLRPRLTARVCGWSMLTVLTRECASKSRVCLATSRVIAERRTWPVPPPPLATLTRAFQWIDQRIG
jgi:hypothetical protein